MPGVIPAGHANEEALAPAMRFDCPGALCHRRLRVNNGIGENESVEKVLPERYITGLAT